MLARSVACRPSLYATAVLRRSGVWSSTLPGFAILGSSLPGRKMPELRLATRRRELLLVLVALVSVPLVLVPILEVDPYLAVVVAVATVALVLAVRSVVYPVALAGLPALFIGYLGSNPFPGKVVFLGLTAWLFLGVGYAFASGQWPRHGSRIASVPLLLTALLAALMVGRIQVGSYPTIKVELFLLQNVPLLVAGILIARRRELFAWYTVVVMTMALANAALLVERISSGGATKVFTGRFTIAVDFNPIAAGRVAATGILVAVALVLGSAVGRRRLYALVSIPFLAIALLSSGSRGPVLALMLALAALIALSVKDKKARSRLLLVAGGASLCVLLAPLIVPSAALRRATGFLTGDTAALSSNGRTQLWHRAIEIFSSHPLNGVGTGGFAAYEPIFRYPHNVVLEAAAELGVLGAVAMVVLLAAALRVAVRNWADAHLDADVTDAALVTSLLVAAVVNAMLSDAIETTDTLWLAIGLVYGVRMRRAAMQSTLEA